MRIAVGGISHETSTFSPFPTTLEDFENGYGLYRGAEVIQRFRGANICTGGFLEGAAKHGFEVVPLLWTFAYPSGLVQRWAYDSLKIEFINRLVEEDAKERIDGVLLDLHGAMVIEGIDDGDGDVIAAVREVLGPDRPIIVTQDLHGNHTPGRVAAADAIIGFDTYPHVDMAERGCEAADVIVATLRGEVQPRTAIRQLPMFWSAGVQVTAHPPMDEVLRQLHALERRPGIISATVATGFPFADVPHIGASVIVVADGDEQLAQAAADELGDWIWEHRQRWYQPPLSAAEALRQGEEQGRYPIILADQADNTGGGAPGDSTEVLRLFLERQLADSLLLYIVDPETVRQAHEAGPGAVIQAQVGGKSHPSQGPPVELKAAVVALSDGGFKYDGPMYAGLTGNMGPSAWIRSDGVNVVLVTAREQPLDQAFARSLGIDCAAMKYICVKSAAHFRSGFESIAGSIYNIDAAALHTLDFKNIPFQRREREMFPVELH